MPENSESRRTLCASNSTRYGLHSHGYVLGKTLGSGTYAKVKVALCVKTNKQVAIKIISKKSAPKDFFTNYLPREIISMKLVEHENVTKLYKVITTDHHTYLVMELAENGDLLDYINARRYLSEPTARNFFGDFVNGMDMCHSMHVVHRDLKCENLLLNADLRLKIGDFGFSRMYEDKKLETYCGSHAYAAPEVLLGTPYNGEKADTWSMGVVLYAMVMGRLPFNDPNVKTLLSKISTRPLYFAPRVSEECKDLITKLLSINPMDRPSMTAIKNHKWMLGDGDTTPVNA